MQQITVLLLLLFSSALPALSYGWGVDGHLMVCQIAQGRLSDAAAAAVKDLLPSYAGNNLSSLCSWADDVKFRRLQGRGWHQGSVRRRRHKQLHLSAPDLQKIFFSGMYYFDSYKLLNSCNSCVVSHTGNKILSSADNLTQALLFLSHFMGDIHQPLHVGFTSDKGGNTIDVHWYTRKTVLHHVWDANIIETAEDDYYGEGVAEFVDTLTKNITGVWSEQVPRWERCKKNQTACPDIYASESITAACDWAYKNVTEDATLEDAYFLSRLPVVNLRLAQGGVRLAATLNRIFGYRRIEMA